MFSMPEIRLNCNRDWKINFDGGDLSSDAGLLLFKEFIHRFGVQTMVNLPTERKHGRMNPGLSAKLRSMTVR